MIWFLLKYSYNQPALFAEKSTNLSLENYVIQSIYAYIYPVLGENPDLMCTCGPRGWHDERKGVLVNIRNFTVIHGDDHLCFWNLKKWRFSMVFCYLLLVWPAITTNKLNGRQNPAESNCHIIGIYLDKFEGVLLY